MAIVVYFVFKGNQMKLYLCQAQAKIFVVLCLSLLFAACDGGVSSSSNNTSATSPAPGNSAPTISGSPVANVTVGNVYSFQPVAADSNGDPLVFNIQNRPVWASFSSSTGLLSGTPTVNNVGSTGNIIITVSDGIASASLAAFSISVNSAPSVTRKYHPGHYVQMYKSDGETQILAVISQPGVVGIERYYTWSEFETGEGVYDFSKIQSDLDILKRDNHGKRLVVQVGDKSFSTTTKPLPTYLDSYDLLNDSPNKPG
jgi:hypothetical protein